MDQQSILFVYGVGGHSSQMQALAPQLTQRLAEFNVISLSDNTKVPTWSHQHVLTGEVRGKHSHWQLLNNLGPFSILTACINIAKHNKVTAVVTTGPGIGVIVGVFFKLLGKKIIHVETNSRFTSRSLTGRMMYHIADQFYIQNKSLQTLYPKAIYGGLL